MNPTPDTSDKELGLDDMVRKFKDYVLEKNDYDELDFKSDLLGWHNHRLEEARNAPVTICGKSVDEIVVILNALDLEQITDIEVTMGNLNKLYKKLVEDVREANEKAINNAFNQLKQGNK
jgi:hypothetical protein